MDDSGGAVTAPFGLLVVGNEEYLRAQAIAAFTQRALEGVDADRHLIAGEDMTPSLADELLGATLFGGTPLLHVTSANKMDERARDTLLSLARESGGVAILEVEKSTDGGAKALTAAAKKAQFVVEVVTPPKTVRDKKTFAMKALRDAGLRPGPGVDTFLAEGEKDLRGIVTRARQLAAGATGPAVTADEARLITMSAAASGFAVADALLARDPRKVATETRIAVEAGGAPLFIQGACLSGLRDLGVVLSGGSLAPWKQKKIAPLARRWSEADLAFAVSQMGVIGEWVRSGHRTKNDLVQALVVAASTRAGR